MYSKKIFEKKQKNHCQNIQKENMEKVKTSEKTCIHDKPLTN